MTSRKWPKLCLKDVKFPVIPPKSVTAEVSVRLHTVLKTVSRQNVCDSRSVFHLRMSLCVETGDHRKSSRKRETHWEEKRDRYHSHEFWCAICGYELQWKWFWSWKIYLWNVVDWFPLKHLCLIIPAEALRTLLQSARSVAQDRTNESDFDTSLKCL